MARYSNTHSVITNFTLNPLERSHYIKPSLATYKQDGVLKNWEVVQSHDSVAILLYHTTKDAFVLVGQFRPAVYVQNSVGMTVELCAGLIDKEKPIKVIAQEEILEECGYDVALEEIEKINSFYTSVGFAGGKQTLYYAEINDTCKVDEGGGIEAEQIEVIYLPRAEAKDFIYEEDTVKTPGLMFAFLWWFNRFDKEV